MLHNPLHSRIAGVLPAGDGATPPPVASKVAVRLPRTATHFTPRLPLEGHVADERVSDAIRRRERRLRDERPVTVELPFSQADLSALEVEIGKPGRDGWPQPGGDSFRALSDREWEPVDDDRIGPVFIGTVALLTGVVLVLTGIAFARLVMVVL